MKTCTGKRQKKFIVVLRCLNQDFPAWPILSFWAKSLFVRGCQEHCRVFSIPEFYLLDASSTPILSRGNQKCSLASPSVPCEGKLSWVQNQWSKWKNHRKTFLFFVFFITIEYIHMCKSEQQQTKLLN